MIVRYSPVFSKIEEATPQEKLLADRTLAVRHPRAFFMKAYHNTMWDGRIQFIKRRKFLSGLLPRLKTALESRGHTLEVIYDDDPELPWKEPLSSFLKDLDSRENQLRLVRAGLKEKRGVLAAPPAAGKTEIMALLLECLRRGNPYGMFPTSLILAPAKSLVKQTKERLEYRLERPVGLIQESRFLPAGVTVGSVQTIYSALKRGRAEMQEYLDTVKVLLIDEVQYLPALSFQIVGESIPAIYRIGVSATPYSKSDPVRNRVLEGLTGPVISEITWKEQFDNKYIAVPHIYFYDVKDTAEIVSEDPSEIYVEGAVFSRNKNRLIRKLVQELVDEKVPTMIMVEYVDHGNLIEELLQDAGIDARFINRKNKTDEYVDDTIEAFRQGEFPVLIATRVFGTGQDIPAIEALIFASEGVKHEMVIQNIGRGIRLKKDRPQRVIVIDFYNRNHELLEDRAKARRRTYRSVKGFILHEKDAPLKLR